MNPLRTLIKSAPVVIEDIYKVCLLLWLESSKAYLQELLSDVWSIIVVT